MSKAQTTNNHHCCNLFQLITIADEYSSYLKNRGFEFTDEGYPVFKKEMFLDDWPDSVIPYAHRNSTLIKAKEKTVLCHFTEDARIYPRLAKLLTEIPEYKKYQGVISTDITVTSDMDIEWQRFIILVNQLYLAVLAERDVKIVLSTRCGAAETIACFRGIPRGVMCASSFLGCSKEHSIEQTDYLVKILSIGASQVILYGIHSKLIDQQLASMGIGTKSYPDYHTACKEVCE